MQIRRTSLRLSKPPSSQLGLTLIELLIALVLSIIVAFAMVAMFTATVGTSTDTLESVRLNQELRGSMQVMTRELRRANYSDGYLQRLLRGDDLTYQPTDGVSNSGGCIQYTYLRGGNTETGAFRVSNNVLQMSTAAAGCGSGDGAWVNLTDPNLIIIEALNVTDNTYTQSIDSDANISQRVYKFTIEIEGRLARCRLPDGNGDCPLREVQDAVRIRNDLLFVQN